MEMGQYTKMMGRLFNGKHNLRVRGRKTILELEPGLGGRVGQSSSVGVSPPATTNSVSPSPMRPAILLPDGPLIVPDGQITH